MTDIPHFDLPLRLKGSSFATVEQGSLDDIINCIIAAIKTEIGTRKELPTFGTTDLTFQNQPVDVAEMINQILVHEPRANIAISQNPNYLNALIASVTAQVSGREESIQE